MAELLTDRDSVVIDASVHKVYERLTEGNDPISVPFRTMKEVFMWAAITGFRGGKRRPLVGKRVPIFHWAQFTARIDIPLLKAIAITESRDLNVLISQDKILTIVEEYANSGIHELSANLLEGSGQALWNLVEMTHQGNE